MNRASLPAGLVLALALGAGCLGQAPHDNPLDPASDRFREEGTLAGQVVDRAERPLADVEVRLIPAQARAELVTRTDGQGRFVFRGAAAGRGYRLQARKAQYAAVIVDALEVRAGFTDELPALRLNALPVFTDAALRTLHVSRWWPANDLFFLDVAADVADADGLLDIDRVWFDVPDLGFSAVLEARAGGRFDRLLPADSLPAASLQALMGLPLVLRVSDREGVVTEDAPRQLARVIEATPVAASPKDRAVLATDRPVLVWEPFPPSFAFSYRVDVFREEVNRDLFVTRREGLPMAATSWQLDAALDPGNYFWIVSVVDEFGNESRSKEVAFTIP